MCIAIYKRAGQPTQKKRTYKRCFDKNSDGAGYAWYNAEKGVWVVKKGLMNFKSFWRAFNKDNNKIGFLDKQLLVHFRVGTSGNRKGPDCTHPFPVTDDYEEMRKLEFETPNLVAHNGVIGPGWGTASDTMVGVKDYIDLLWDKREDKRALALWKEHLKFDKCRWFIAEGKEVYLFGTWIDSPTYESKFSNNGYLPDPPKQTHIPTKTAESPSGAVTDDNPPWWHKDHRVTTQRYYNEADYNDFCDKDGNWSWSLWAAAHATHYATKNVEQTDDNDLTSPNEMADYIECPASVMALLDKEGNILWDDDYVAADDLPACPSCLSENLIESGMLHGDMGCADCGCIFQSDTGDIIVYDPSICKSLTVTLQCLTCHEQVKMTNDGECPDCGTILDPTLAERRIKEQLNG